MSLRAESPYDNVSVAYDRDAWGKLTRPEKEKRIRSSKEPRPQLADASPHSRVDRLIEEERPGVTDGDSEEVSVERESEGAESLGDETKDRDSE